MTVTIAVVKDLTKSSTAFGESLETLYFSQTVERTKMIGLDSVL